MIVVRKIAGLQRLADFFRGTPIAAASNLTNGAGSPNISVPAASGDTPDFTDVEVGDRFYISGESTATVFLVTTKTDAQNIVLDNNVVNANTGDGIWRAVKPDGFGDPSGLDIGPDPLGNDTFLVGYDSSTFGVV